MSAKVIPFPNPNNDAIVKLLEQQLALAKEGRFRFVALAVVSTEMTGCSAWAPDGDIGQHVITAGLGAISFLDARFKESALLGAEDTSEPDEAA